MNESVPNSHPSPPSAVRWGGYLIGPGFFLLAAWFLWGAEAGVVEIPAAQRIDPAMLSTAPRRKILKDPPRIMIAGFERTCMDCHIAFPARENPPERLLQHQHIVLDHGINDRCRNCHYPEDRDKLVLRGGEIISYDEVDVLCAKCHGPTYRDWQRGAHGRTNGYWDHSAGPSQRLKCTECHDPHQPRIPAMDPMVPLPGPRTLRMGVPLPAPDEHKTHDPLDWHRHSATVHEEDAP